MTCRKAHASAFNPFVVFDVDQVEVAGPVRAWESSPGHERRFCAECGSRVAMRTIDSDEIEISMGSFDEVGLFAPEYESWIVRREPWQPALMPIQNVGDRDPT